MKIVWGILILLVIVVAHELGHFLIARLNGIDVKEFTIGFGPKLFGKQFKSGTKFSIRLILIGAACVFEELDEQSENDDIETIYANSAYRKANVWARIATTVAGPLFNLILAFLVGLFLMNYVNMPTTEITGIIDDSAAAEAGLMVGDRICKINNSRTYLYPEVSLEVQLGYGKPLKVVYERDGKKNTVSLVPRMSEEYGYYMIGVEFGGNSVPEKKGSLSIIKDSYLYVRYMVKMTVDSIRMLFTGAAKVTDLAGPVGAVEIVGDEYEVAKKEGSLAVVVSMLNIMLLLSANLGIVNLFPLPAFDGGKLLFLLYEAIRKKPADAKVESAIQVIGIALLLILLVIVMYNDIMRLFVG